MSSQYRRAVVQTPKAYDELNRNRPTRKRVYDYSAPPDTVNIPISNYQSNTRKQFSFQRQETTLFAQMNSSVRKQSPREQKKRRSPESKHDIDQRLTNISSIHDKITGALNRPRRQEKYTERAITRKQNTFSKDKPIVQKQPISYTSRYNYQNQSGRSRRKYSFRSKYAIDEDAVTVPKRELTAVRYTNQNDYSSRVSRKDSVKQSGGGQFNSNLNTSKISEEYKISVTPFKSQENKQKRSKVALSEVNANSVEDEYKKEKAIIQNIILDKQIKERQDKILQNSPLRNIKAISPAKQANTNEDKNTSAQIKDKGSPEIAKFIQKSQTMKLADALSRLVKVDTALFKYRQAFESIKDEQKWQRLNSELHINKVYMQESVMKDYIKIAIQEKDPFRARVNDYSLNQIKDMAKLIGEAQQLWNHQIYKCVSRQNLQAEDFSLLSIDLSSKGTIGLQDLTCFINVNSQNFFRSRDVATVYRRFLKLEGKGLDKASEGMLYGTFMDRVAG